MIKVSWLGICPISNKRHQAAAESDGEMRILQIDPDYSLAHLGSEFVYVCVIFCSLCAYGCVIISPSCSEILVAAGFFFKKNHDEVVSLYVIANTIAVLLCWLY